MISYLKKLFCRHKKHTKVVLGLALTVEFTADKCSRCGKLSNKQWEL